jgi:L-alanine-DL-glutamate epimerase-like enolase superfamily enzyme
LCRARDDRYRAFPNGENSLNALFKNAPEPQNGTFPVPSGPGLGLELDLEKLEPRIKPL